MNLRFSRHDHVGVVCGPMSGQGIVDVPDSAGVLERFDLQPQEVGEVWVHEVAI